MIEIRKTREFYASPFAFRRNKICGSFYEFTESIVAQAPFFQKINEGV